MRVVLDAGACVGHGRCYALAPDVFVPDDDGHCLIVAPGDVDPEYEGQARRGAANCPELALHAEE